MRRPRVGSNLRTCRNQDEPLPHFAELATLTPAARSTASQVLSPADFALMFNARSRQLGWFLGAGTSAAAGIPTGYDMIVEFKTRLFLPRHRSRRP